MAYLPSVSFDVARVSSSNYGPTAMPIIRVCLFVIPTHTHMCCAFAAPRGFVSSCFSAMSEEEYRLPSAYERPRPCLHNSTSLCRCYSFACTSHITVFFWLYAFATARSAVVCTLLILFRLHLRHYNSCLLQSLVTDIRTCLLFRCFPHPQARQLALDATSTARQGRAQRVTVPLLTRLF